MNFLILFFLKVGETQVVQVGDKAEDILAFGLGIIFLVIINILEIKMLEDIIMLIIALFPIIIFMRILLINILLEDAILVLEIMEVQYTIPVLKII